jgi:hypothetical protein
VLLGSDHCSCLSVACLLLHLAVSCQTPNPHPPLSLHTHALPATGVLRRAPSLCCWAVATVMVTSRPWLSSSSRTTKTSGDKGGGEGAKKALLWACDLLSVCGLWAARGLQQVGVAPPSPSADLFHMPQKH